MSAVTKHIVHAMMNTGQRQREASVIATWKAAVEQWAKLNPGNPDAEAVLSWLPHWQARPFYTADELAPMWPALAIATGFTDQWPVRKSLIKSAVQLEFELDFYGLPRLSYCPRYFIVERIKYWQFAKDSEVMQELQNAYR